MVVSPVALIALRTGRAAADLGSRQSLSNVGSALVWAASALAALSDPRLDRAGAWQAN